MRFNSFLIAAACTIVQYYDYHLFGFLAAKISKHFFDHSDSVLPLLKTYFVMAVAVLAKPIGALILGRIGDIYGRFATVIISLSGTAAASLVIGLSPGYESIGILSALLLLGARTCVAGLVSSGTDGIRIYIFEKIGTKKQCLGNGFITFSTQFGSFIASVSAWFFSLDFMPYYSWRIAFLIGTLMGIVVIFIRMKYMIEEDVDKKNPEYEAYKNQNTFRIALENIRLFLPCILLAGCIGSTYQFVIIFFGTYNFEILKIVAPTKMQFFTSTAIIIYMTFSIIGGLCADYFGKRLIANIAGFCLIIITALFTYKISKSNFSLVLYFFITITLPFITMPALAFLKQAIPQVIRYRIFSLAHAFGSILISAPTSYISTYLYYKTKAPWIPMLYFAITIFIMLGAINFLSKHIQKSHNKGKY